MLSWCRLSVFLAAVFAQGDSETASFREYTSAKESIAIVQTYFETGQMTLTAFVSRELTSDQQSGPALLEWSVLMTDFLDVDVGMQTRLPSASAPLRVVSL
ncbi:hypothetical protein BaRGS_00015291 [Batillaria attramentaria]|uniref:Uncharacterized protein n=1 Tax=Batillaria attramentaria TaxID=370345 RepID=A0ABD0L1K9_9CAEN